MGVSKWGPRRGQGGHASSPIFSIFHRFVLREAVSQTKYCCSLKDKYLPLPKILAWLYTTVHGHRTLVVVS